MMSGLDRIIEKINADSLASCREIADQAQKKAQDIAEDANAHAEKAYSDIIYQPISPRISIVGGSIG